MLSATHFDESRGARAREIRPRSDRRHPLSLGDLSSVSFGSHHKIFHNPRLFSIMVPLTVMRSKAPNGVMGKQGSKSGRTTYSLVTSGIALFFLVQTLAFVFSPNGRIAFSNGGAGASSIAMAGEVCLANADDGGKAPKPNHQHHRHCAVCVASNRDFPLPASALIAAVVAFIPPPPDEAPPRFSRDELAPPPLGWTSSWSSRAPPSFS